MRLAGWPGRGLPPLSRCIDTGHAPRECIIFHAWLVELAARDGKAFQAEVAQIPEEHRDGWVQKLMEFARLSGSQTG